MFSVSEVAGRGVRLVAVSCGVLMSASCFYVWDESQYYRPVDRTRGAEAGAQATGPQRLEDLPKPSETRSEAETREPSRPPAQTTPPPPRSEPSSSSVPVARAVPGREGFVFSPFNNKLIDVKGVPSGTPVRDPHYPASENKIFRVP